MKQILAVLCGGCLALALSGGAFAATVTKTVTFDNPVQVNGTTLQPGDYKVSYEDSSPNPQVTFEKGKKKVATVPGQLKPLGAKSNSTSIVWNTQGSTTSLQEIHFSGTSQALVLQENGSNTSGQ